MVCSLPCRWLDTALAMPMPPTSRAARPASVRKRPTRSSWRRSDGLASRVSRSRQPPSGNASSSAAVQAASAAPSGRERAVAVPHQGARPHQPGRRERFVIEHQAGPEGDAGGQPVGLAREHGAHRERRRADPDALAGPDPEPVEQSPVGHRAAVGKRVGERHAALQPHVRDQRIGGVHRLELDQRAARAVRGVGHAAHGDDVGEGGAVRLDPGTRLARQRLREQHQLHVAAEDHPRVAREPRLERVCEGADRGGGGDAQNQAGEEDAEAAHAAPELAPGDAPGRPSLMGRGRQEIRSRSQRRPRRP